MVNWQSSLWKRWITQFRHWAPSGCRHNGSAARRRRAAKQWLGLECLEDRLLPAFVSFSLAADEPQVDPQPPVAFDVLTPAKENSAVEIDVLANAFDPDGTLDSATLMIGSGPAHGTATVRQSSLDSPIVLYVPDTGFRGRDVFRYTVRDNDGAISNAAFVVVTVFNEPPVAVDDSVSTPAETPVVIDVLANDFDPDGTLDASSLTISSRPSRGTASVQQTEFGPVVIYTPDRVIVGRPSQAVAANQTAWEGRPTTVLVVDDPRDVNDGDYSRGHLSLREAIFLANADTDSFTYTVRDDDGLTSHPATVTVPIPLTPTTITFAPRLTAHGSVTIAPVQVGDTSVGNPQHQDRCRTHRRPV